MKFIHLFLVGYFVLIVAVALALWQTGVLNRLRRSGSRSA
jgi:hypothetical protein